MNEFEVIKKWVEEVVIGLNLCPFAKRPYESGLIPIDTCFQEKSDDRLEETLLKIEEMKLKRSDVISNRIIIFPHAEKKFLDFLQFQSSVEDELLVLNWHDEFQLVAFHPDFQFENSHPDDLENLVNSAPWPLLHILRTSEVMQAARNQSSPEEIHDRNIRTLNELTLDQLSRLFYWKSNLFKN